MNTPESVYSGEKSPRKGANKKEVQKNEYLNNKEAQSQFI